MNSERTLSKDQSVDQSVVLYPHQKQALDDTRDLTHVAYFYDMGLGKTFIGSEKTKALNRRYNLVVCQLSKVEDWVKHFSDYYHSHFDNNIFNLRNQKEMHEFIERGGVGVINYELLWRRKILHELKDFTLMLDESSEIKSEKTKKTKCILKLRPECVILLSGSPCGGKYENLYAQCRMLGWDIKRWKFNDRYVIYKEIDMRVGFPIPVVVGYRNVDELNQNLRDHGARFLKTEEVFDLPKQTHIDVQVENTKEYKRFKRDLVMEIDGKTLVGDNTLTRLLYLRQLAGAYNKNKWQAVKDLVESTDDRLIIFYNFNDELAQLQEICKEKPVSIMSGSTKDLTNYETKENAITLVQYQAGSMGLNLQKANRIIYASPPLSSEYFEQSKKRIHRIGQDRPCFYYYLKTKESVEENIYSTLAKRQDYTNKLFEEDFDHERKSI